MAGDIPTPRDFADMCGPDFAEDGGNAAPIPDAPDVTERPPLLRMGGMLSGKPCSVCQRPLWRIVRAFLAWYYCPRCDRLGS